jgi:hypothetical protein
MNVSCVLDSDLSGLYKSCEDNEHWNVNNLQTFNPIFEKCFNIKHNDENIKYLRLNHRYVATRIHPRSINNDLIFDVKDSENGVKKERKVFVKTCHLLDPIKYMMDEYRTYQYGPLPYMGKPNKKTNSKIQDPNNKGYIDGFFCYLSSKLVENDICPHFPLFYGHAIGISKEYKFDITDEFYSIRNTRWFHRNINKTFNIAYMLEGKEEKILSKDQLQIETDTRLLEGDDNSVQREFCVNDSDLESIGEDDIDITEYTNINDETIQNISVPMDERSRRSSASTLSSRSSSKIVESRKNRRRSRYGSVDSITNENIGYKDRSDDESDDYEEDTDDDSDDEDDNKFLSIIRNYPVILTLQEKCEGTLEDLCNENPRLDIWGSYLFQIVFALATCQYYFDFTHNDLHCNNIMYQRTNKKYLYYQVTNKYFRIPTNGIILKIIDFGRAIYKVKERLFISDDFKHDNDAGGQYNFPPYYNPKYKKVTPNKSFDLCRLATSIFEILYPEPESYNPGCPLFDLLDKWLKDKYGKSILFNSKGEERYENFDLYKVIARRVVSAVPKAQFSSPLFRIFMIPKEEIPHNEKIYKIYPRD